VLAGFAYGAADAAHAEAQTGMTDDQWWNMYATLLEQMMDSGLCLLAGRVGSAPARSTTPSDRGASVRAGAAACLTEWRRPCMWSVIALTVFSAVLNLGVSVWLAGPWRAPACVCVLGAVSLVGCHAGR
jgi:hypothetical protein